MSITDEVGTGAKRRSKKPAESPPPAAILEAGAWVASVGEWVSIKSRPAAGKVVLISQAGSTFTARAPDGLILLGLLADDLVSAPPENMGKQAEAPMAPFLSQAEARSYGLPPVDALAYALHRAALVERLGLLASQDDEQVLGAVAKLLRTDGEPVKAAEVEERIAVLRRGRADAAGVPREDAVERPVVLRAKSGRWLPVPLSPEQHQAARLDYIAQGRRLSDAEAAEGARSAAARGEIKQIRAEVSEALERAYRGTEPGEVEVEERIMGRVVETVRLDTGEVIDQRRATDAEVDDASQMPLWAER